MYGKFGPMTIVKRQTRHSEDVLFTHIMYNVKINSLKHNTAKFSCVKSYYIHNVHKAYAKRLKQGTPVVLP